MNSNAIFRLMNIAQYLEETRTSQAAFAAAVGVTQSMAWQWISGRRPVPVERCADIERVTAGAVSRRDLRPEDWARIWPELATAAPAQQEAA
ncbi:transcriptional regulator [Achromobacter xylosoxidans]